MIHSLLLLGSSYNKNNKISNILKMMLVISIILNKNGDLNFVLFNVLTLVILCNGINRINNIKIKKFLSMSSILVWSVIIDIFCYYYFSTWNYTSSIIEYIFNGICFNCKYLFLNCFVLNIMEAFEKIIFKLDKKLLKIA